MAIEASSHTAETPSVEEKEPRDIERIKALMIASEKTLDNHDIAKKLGLDADYVEKLCFDIYDAMVIAEREDEEPIGSDEMMQWLKENE